MVRNRKLKAVMAYHGVTQEDLASVLKLKRSSIGNKINGYRDWKYYSEVVPIVEFFNQLSEGLHTSGYDVEDVFPASEGKDVKH